MMLPDVNAWLALTFESHVHHGAASSWFRSLDSGSAAFCRITMLGFLRLVQNDSAFPGEAVPAERAWAFYEDFCSDERVVFVPEPPGIDELLASYFSGKKARSPKAVTDAYLAAFARLAGHSLYTFDMALRKHPLLK